MAWSLSSKKNGLSEGEARAGKTILSLGKDNTGYLPRGGSTLLQDGSRFGIPIDSNFRLGSVGSESKTRTAPHVKSTNSRAIRVRPSVKVSAIKGGAGRVQSIANQKNHASYWRRGFGGRERRLPERNFPHEKKISKREKRVKRRNEMFKKKKTRVHM